MMTILVLRVAWSSNKPCLSADAGWTHLTGDHYDYQDDDDDYDDDKEDNAREDLVGGSDEYDHDIMIIVWQSLQKKRPLNYLHDGEDLDDHDLDHDIDDHDHDPHDNHCSGPTTPRRRPFYSSSEAFSSVNPPSIQCNAIKCIAFFAAKSKTLHCFAVQCTKIQCTTLFLADKYSLLYCSTAQCNQ